MDKDLPGRLRRLRERLAPLLEPPRTSPGAPGGPDEIRSHARAAADLLDRDLLPRTAGADSYLVVGLVGPNNAGKSTLFNSLVGRVASPAVPTGGATRRLLGAAHPELVQRLADEPTLARFPLVRHTGELPVQSVLEDGEDPAELCVVPVEDLPPAVLVIDTPDFDSVLERNRLASESLLQVADLALVVVTRHTYQNKEVVAFLEGWLAHGRPWLLVYNESLGDEVTADHAAKLASDLDAPPVAVFQAPFDLSVQRDGGVLRPAAIATRGGPAAGTDLAAWLFDLGQAERLKGRALDASLARLHDHVSTLVRLLRERGVQAEAVLGHARSRAMTLGTEVAARAMPMGPFLEAFRSVLDRRPNLVQRRLRAALRRTRLFLEGLVSRVASAPKGGAGDAAGELAAIERRELEPRWAPFYEELSAALVPRGTFWEERGEELGLPDGELAASLAADLAAAATDAARERALATVGSDPEVLRAFESACEELIEDELDGRRGGDWVLQFAVDGMHLLPLVAAGVVIFKTGGLGADVAVAGAGALSTLMAERLSKLLGTDVAHRARTRWSRLRGERLGHVLVEAVLEESGPLLERRAAATATLAGELAAAMTHGEETA